jgi:RsiW-degrading membrane proteinase PrsW (M82 family)
MDQWLLAGPSPIVKIAAAILVIGVVQEYCKYASVRFSLYRSAEFDEATDGVVYCSAAGLGYALALNLHSIVAQAGMDLGAVIMLAVIQTIAQASFAGISGFFLGRTKFAAMPAWWMPLGFLAACAANGLVQYAIGTSSRRGLAWVPGLGFLVAGLFAIAVYALLFGAVKLQNDRALKAAKKGGAA